MRFQARGSAWRMDSGSPENSGSTAIRGAAYLAAASGTTVINSKNRLCLDWEWIRRTGSVACHYRYFDHRCERVRPAQDGFRSANLRCPWQSPGGTLDCYSRRVRFDFCLRRKRASLRTRRCHERQPPYSAQSQLGIGYELDAIAAVIFGGTSLVGGIGTVFGTLIGALIIVVLNNGLTLMNVYFYWQLVIKGTVIILAVMLDKFRTRGQVG